MRELLKVLIRIAVAIEAIVTNTTPAEPPEDDTTPADPPAEGGNT